MVELYQILYKEEHRKELFPFSIPYFNTGLTVYFENAIISELVKASEAEKIGVCSWKLRDKMKKRVGPRAPLTPEALQNEFQVLSFTRNTQNHDMIARAKVWHPGFYPALEMLWQKLGFQVPHRVKVPIYFNHFVARSAIYKDYVTNFLDPAMEVIQKDEELNKLMMTDSHYQNLNPQADTEGLKKIGLSYYPMIPFVLERCPSLFFSMKKIKVDYL